MAAQILEPQPDTETAFEDLTDTESMSPDEVVASLQGAPQEAPEEDDLPDKYRGKSVKEIVAMHQEAERLIGSHSSEVGELRKVVDTYIQSQLQNQRPAEPEEPEIDFFENPSEAVNRAIEKHPEVVAARQTAQEYRHTQTLQQLAQKHPDVESVLQNPSFQEWAFASPIRKELWQRADQNYDFAAVDELLTTWKERTSVVQKAVASEQESRSEAVRGASTGGSAGSSAGGAKKIYKRADIIKLMKTDPARYEAMSDELTQAYLEKRVR